MILKDVDLTLLELQEALADYVKKKTGHEAEFVSVVSHGKTRIYVELRPTGLVEAFEFKHRSQP